MTTWPNVPLSRVIVMKVDHVETVPPEVGFIGRVRMRASVGASLDLRIPNSELDGYIVGDEWMVKLDRIDFHEEDPNDPAYD